MHMKIYSGGSTLKAYFLLAAILTLTITLVSCSSGGGGSSGNSDILTVADDSSVVARDNIGAAGGSVSNSNQNSVLYGASVYIQEGALDEDIEIRLAGVLNGAAYENNAQNSLLVSLEPHDTIFNRPVEITIPFNQTDNLNNLAVFYFDETDLIWKQIPTTAIDTTHNTVTGLTDHSGIFTVKHSWFHFNVNLYQSGGQISANIKLATSWYNIPLVPPNSVPAAVNNFGLLFDEHSDNTTVRYRVQLKKNSVLWYDEIISARNIEYQVSASDNPVATGYELSVRDFSGNPAVYNNIVLAEPVSGDIEKIKSFYSGERVLFRFDDDGSLDPAGVYYLDISYQYLKGESVLAEGTLSTKNSYLVNPGQFAVTPDQNSDRLMDGFDGGASSSSPPLISPPSTSPSTSPFINSFAATPTNIAIGESSTLVPVFGNGTGNIDNGIGEVASGANISVSPGVSATYRLTVTNSAGIAISQDVTLSVNDGTAPGINSFTASPATIAPGGTTTLAPVFYNGTGSIDNGIGAVTSGAGISVSPAASTVYTLTVTNSAGISTSQPLTVAIYNASAPAINGFTASPASIDAGATSTLTPYFTKGAGSIDNGVGAVTSATDISVSPGVSTIYTLTVTNGAGTSVSQAVTIIVNDGTEPDIASFTASPAVIKVGETAVLTPAFSNGSGSINKGINAVTSGASVSVSPGVSTIYTLTVINSAGIAVSRVVTVTVNPL